MLTNDWAVEKDAVIMKSPESWSKNCIRPVNTLTVGAVYVRLPPWSQRFFSIFLRERDQEQAAKRRQRVAKATRRERKTSGYLGLESHFHAEHSCQTCQIANKKSGQWQFSKHVLLSGGRPGEILLWTNHLHLGGEEWFVNRAQAKACVNNRRQESRNKNTTLQRNHHCSKRLLQGLQNLCKISGRSKINVFGYNNKDFSQTLSSFLSAVYISRRDYLSEVPAGSCKVCKSLSIALIILFTSVGRAVRVDSRAFPPK